MQEAVGTFELVIGGSIMIFIISGLFIILYFHFSRKVVINKLQQNQLTLEHQKELLKNEIAIIEKERKRFARDLHDEIGANMAYIGINLAQLTKECPTNAQFHEKLTICQTQLNQAISDVRRISHDLLPPILEMFGLIPAIDEFISKLNSSFTIDFSHDESFNDLGSDTALHLYRVLLELINNSIKHSGGDRIELRMYSLQGEGFITYSDNGTGFDMNSKKASSGLGMKNIISRLEAIDAVYTFNSSRSTGFLIEIKINHNQWKDTQ